MCHFGLFCLQMTKPVLPANFNYHVLVLICALKLADLMPLVMVLGDWSTFRRHSMFSFESLEFLYPDNRATTQETSPCKVFLLLIGLLTRQLHTCITLSLELDLTIGIALFCRPKKCTMREV